jgi:hypothetical protein
LKTDKQLARTELELRAVDSAYDTLRYLGFRPKQDTWSSYCRNLGYKLHEALERAEFWEKNPDYKFG